MKLTGKILIIALCGSSLLACSTNANKRSADDESYDAIADKSMLVPGMSGQVVVDEERVVDLSLFGVNSDSFEFLFPY